MVMSINDFKAIVEDVARPNRFLVQILPNPSVWQPNGDANLLDVARQGVAGARVVLGDPRQWFYLVKAINMPVRTLGILEHKRMGFTRKVAGDPVYEDLSITFYNDNNYVARSLCETWHESIASGVTNLRQLDDRYSQGSFIMLEQMSASNLPTAIWKFTDVWPSAIESGTDFDQASNDQASEFTVKFTFNNWTRIL